MKTRFINKIIFYTVLVFCISAFSYFPKSYSKYIKDESPINFYVGIDKLYIGDIQNLSLRSTSDYKTIDYQYKFERSQVMKETDDSQEITVTIEHGNINASNDVCQITKIYSKGNVELKGHQATIIYTTPGTDTVIVEYSCNVSDITVNDEIYTNVYVNEKFMPENVPYLYTKNMGVPMTTTEYYKDHKIPDAIIEGNTIIIDDSVESKYDSFIVLISSMYGNSYSDAIKKYVKTKYNGDSDILNPDITLKGITYTRDLVNNKHKYQIDDDFLGYARTDSHIANFDTFIKFYYSNTELTDTEANGILRYYLETYGVNYGYTAEDINKIIAYVSEYGSLNYIIKPNDDSTYNKMAGFTYVNPMAVNDYDIEIMISYILMNIINASLDKKITIPFNEPGPMYSIYNQSLATTFDFLSSELINILKTDKNVYLPIYKSIVKNSPNMTNTPSTYSDYFTIKDSANNYILVNVYSDRLSTYVEIIELGVADAIAITNVDNQMNISISLSDQSPEDAKTNITNIVSILDIYLETNYSGKIVDELFTESKTIEGVTSLIDGTNITVSYTISDDLDSSIIETETTGDPILNNSSSSIKNNEETNTLIPEKSDSSIEKIEETDNSVLDSSGSIVEGTEEIDTLLPENPDSSINEKEEGDTSVLDNSSSSIGKIEETDNSVLDSSNSTVESAEEIDTSISENSEFSINETEETNTSPLDNSSASIGDTDEADTSMIEDLNTSIDVMDV